MLRSTNLSPSIFLVFNYNILFLYRAITLSNMVRWLQNFAHVVSQTTWTNAADLVTVPRYLKRAITDQYKSWSYLESKQQWPTDGRTNGRTDTLCQIHLLKDFVLGDKVSFHRPYMAKRCIKVRGDGTMATLAIETTEMSVFFCVSRFQKNGKFAASYERPKALCFSFRGVPDQGLCPWTPLGAPPLDPCYRLALCARHGLPPTFKHLPLSMVETDTYIDLSKIFWQQTMYKYLFWIMLLLLSIFMRDSYASRIPDRRPPGKRLQL